MLHDSTVVFLSSVRMAALPPGLIFDIGGGGMGVSVEYMSSRDLWNE